MTNSKATSTIDRSHEDQLMERIASKDETAFKEFEQKYRNLIFTTAFNVLNHRQDAEDIVNDILLKVWQKAETYHGARGSLVTWICTLTRNRSIDIFRSQKRRFNLNDQFREEMTIRSEGGECGLKPILQSDQRKKIDSHLALLSDKQRETVELIYLQGLTQKEAARRLNRPLGTVKAQVTQGLSRMRDIMPVK